MVIQDNKYLYASAGERGGNNIAQDYLRNIQEVLLELTLMDPFQKIIQSLRVNLIGCPRFIK